MEFQNSKAIYLQLADHLCLAILNGTYPEDERIPSVRDFAASVEVNANTAVRPTNGCSSRTSSTHAAAWATSSHRARRSASARCGAQPS